MLAFSLEKLLIVPCSVNDAKNLKLRALPAVEYQIVGESQNTATTNRPRQVSSETFAKFWIAAEHFDCFLDGFPEVVCDSKTIPAFKILGTLVNVLSCIRCVARRERY